jgi:Na+/H+ antiporter NhaC
MFFFYIGQGLMTADEFTDYCIEGLKNMLLPILLMILAFLFSGAADRIQFTQTIIEWLVPIMTPELMAIEIFIVLAITEFITGTNWGLYIIALPIVIPLSQAIGGNTVLAVSSVLSAGVFGSHICFYSDATILSSSASGCNNFDHAITQLPYGLLAGSLAGICFLVTGFIMH